MGLDPRAVTTGGYWRSPYEATLFLQKIVTFGYAAIAAPHSIGGITDSTGDDWLDSEGGVIFDSTYVPLPSTPFGYTGSIPTFGYWNFNASELNARIASFGYLGSFTTIPNFVFNIAVKSWISLNAVFKLR